MVHHNRPAGDHGGGPQNRAPLFSLFALLILWLLVSDPGQEMVGQCISQATSWGISAGILAVVPPKRETLKASTAHRKDGGAGMKQEEEEEHDDEDEDDAAVDQDDEELNGETLVV